MKFKSFISGIVIGTVLATSMSVLADEDGRVSVWMTDYYKIMVDGQYVDLPEGMHILNYEDRIYTPTRLVAEALGGQVGWDGVNKTVTILSPTPEPVEVEPTPEVTPIETPAPVETIYQPAPIKLRQDNYTVNVFGIRNSINTTNVYMDIKNENSQFMTIDYKNAYIEIDRVRYLGTNDLFSTWGNSIPEYGEVNDIELCFDKIPEGTKKMTIVIPLERQAYVENVGPSQVKSVFTLHIEFADEQY